MEVVAEVPFTYSPFFIVVIVGVIFSLGVLVRHILDGDFTISILEILAVIVGGFFAFGLPLCYPLQLALKASNGNFLIVSPSVLPIFVSGFFARSEFLRWKKSSNDSAQQP